MDYNHRAIEKKWQKLWEEKKLHRAIDNSKKPKCYILDMFPYPSGAGLHVGHPEGYTATDIISRFKRMNGFNVLHPMGWDAFGLPAENYAIKTGTHPKTTTEKNVGVFKKQIQSLGFSYDWDREVNTTNPEYVRWTQWIFLQIFKKGLAYEANMPINWCVNCKTGLANEEVKDGKCDRCGSEVIRKNLRQWVLKITAYAERLLEDLNLLDWSESIKLMQKNWIGKSEGASVFFPVKNSAETIEVYTTRPDTLFGATYMVLSPEHPLVNTITSKEQSKIVKAYQEKSAKKSDLERTELAKEKTGVFTGAYAINPVNKKEIPIWISDYVLISYGTGAIMAVPAHDTRDYEFAKKFRLPIQEVVKGGNVEKEAFVDIDNGEMVNSDFLNGMKPSAAIKKMTEWLENKKIGKKAVNFKLRDWIFSRQRYWGEPIPVVHCEKCGVVPVPEKDLPILLPPVRKYEPTGTGESPLAGISKWVNTTCPKCKGKAKRETNTMPQWAGSCWYYLGYLFSNEGKIEKWDKNLEKYWMQPNGVDLYVGGAEHAVLHLLYARFWHKVLFDLGYVSTKEPFHKLRNQGMILGEDGEKMSKSRGNVINPDSVVKQYGADTLRLYEMFMGPFEAVKPWNMQGVEGVHRFLLKVWRLFEKPVTTEAASKEAAKITHKTVKKVTEDIESFGFNTAISQMMICVNELGKLEKLPKEIGEKLLLVLSPFAPHLTEELWEKLGHKTGITTETWPTFDITLTVDDEISIAVQVNGKLRGTFQAPVGISQKEALAKAKELENVKKHLENGKLIKEIFVPGKIVNLVVVNP